MMRRDHLSSVVSQLQDSEQERGLLRKQNDFLKEQLRESER